MDKSQPLYGLISGHPISGRPMMLERKAFDYLLSKSNEPMADIKAFDFGGNNNPKPFELINGVAIIPVHGPLSKRSGIFDAFFGFTSYELLSELLGQALDNSEVNAILLDVDSPGGEVAGLFDFADEIFTARTKKPIWAVANEEAFSAAYAIASSASKIFVSRTGGIGSIGVLATHVDQSSFDEKQGIKVTTIFAGDRKNDLNPHESLTTDAAKVLQDEVNRLYEMFIGLVSRNRKITSANVRNTEAGLFFGSDGISMGLADDILTMPQVLELMTHKFQPKLMSKTMTKNAPTLEKESIAEKVELKSQTDAVTANAEIPASDPIIDIDTITKEAAAKGRAAYRTEILELAKTCTAAQMPSMLADLVERNVGVQAAKDELMQMLVAQNQYGKSLSAESTSGETEISSSVVPLETGKPKESPVVAAAKAKAAEAK
ncbi:MAG: S49 family peptidase [Proteobacteria bacterium]|nr:S49 family peptidase [Pseudomonadota bacterium]